MSTQMTIEFPEFRPFIPVAKGYAAGLATALLVALLVAGQFRKSHAGIDLPAPARTVAEFTGTYERGVPVYRLPPLEITARRDANQAGQARRARIGAAKMLPSPPFATALPPDHADP
jgi:hypothetical protein